MWEVLGIAITSLHIAYSDLPTTAYSYDGEARDISQFYDQSIPNIYLDGYSQLDNNNWVTWNLDTGTHTDKLDTVGLGLGINHRIEINNSTDLTLSASTQYSYTGHSSCSDEYNRKYYCGNLTAFSDIESEQHVFNNQISLRLTTRW